MGRVSFINKAYAMVDDPSRDSVTTWSQDGKSFIVWHPAEFCRVLGIPNFNSFLIHGFTKKESGRGILELTSDHFVRGQPELLEKIWERHVERRKAYHDSHVQPLYDRMDNCKNMEEVDSVFAEYMEEIRRKTRERIDKAFATELDKLMARIASEKATRIADL